MTKQEFYETFRQYTIFSLGMFVPKFNPTTFLAGNDINFARAINRAARSVPECEYTWLTENEQPFGRPSTYEVEVFWKDESPE